MSCDRCSDIHDAQKKGVTTKPCKCECHSEISPFPITPFPLTNGDTNWVWRFNDTQNTPCCACTDPANKGKALWLVCNCSKCNHNLTC